MPCCLYPVPITKWPNGCALLDSIFHYYTTPPWPWQESEPQPVDAWFEILLSSAELSCGGCFPSCLFDAPFGTRGLKENNLPRIHVTEKNTQSSTGVLAHRDMTETHKSDMYWQKTETGGEYFSCAVQSQTVYLNSANTVQNKPVRQPGCYMTHHDRYALIFNMDKAKKKITLGSLMPKA